MIIVTGVSGGIGSRLLKELAGIDEPVIGTFHNREPSRKSETGTRLFRVDVTDPDSTRQFAKEIEPLANRITLVNLAGLSISSLAVDLDPADWDRVVDTSLKGSLLMSQAVLKIMIRQKWGRIINISSVVARTGVVGTSAYAAAKAGLDGFTRTLAAEYGRYGILVNTLVLGYFDCGMADQLTQGQRDAVLSRIPLRRFGEVTELTEAIRFLIRSNYVTGASINIDGGIA